MVDTVRKHAQLVMAGEVVLEHLQLLCVLEVTNGWGGTVMFHVLDLETGKTSNEFFAAFDMVNVLI